MYTKTSIYHLVNDSLMPELNCYADSELFRRLWRPLHIQLLENVPTFINPIEAFEANGLPLYHEIKSEWQHLSKISLQDKTFPPLKKLNTFYPKRAKTRFFILLFWQSLHFEFEISIADIKKETNVFQKQYILMQWMINLEQYLEDNKDNVHHNNEIRQGFHQLMAYYWLLTYRYLPSLIHLESLRFFEEEMLEVFQFQSPKNSLHNYLKDQLFETSKETISKEATASTLMELAKDMQTEFKDLKTSVLQMKAGTFTTMHRESYLKPKEAAQMLGISTQTLSNWRIKGKLKDYKKNGNRYEYSFREIQKTIQSPT